MIIPEDPQPLSEKIREDVASSSNQPRVSSLSHTPSPRLALRPWKVIGSSYRLTLLGRCFLLLLVELSVNITLWITAICLFTPNPERRSVMSLALIAWTLGLRHGLDMDHIVAIDNVTRNLVSMGQLPVTCGLFFSLGHSTIVVGVTIAIIISTAAIAKLPSVGAVGGVIGVSISASFLLILAIINSFVLYQCLRRQREAKTSTALENGSDISNTATIRNEPFNASIDQKRVDIESATAQINTKGVTQKDENDINAQVLPATTCLARIGKPVFKFIDRPWKMYPVGVLFGFGFDTSSEIALLGVSALARGSGQSPLPASQILILPLLFTGGMTLVDSCDSIFMLHAYALPSRLQVTDEGRAGRWSNRWRLLEQKRTTASSSGASISIKPIDEEKGEVQNLSEEKEMPNAIEAVVTNSQKEVAGLPSLPKVENLLTIQILLTVISISMALLICIVEFMGLALEKCAKCSDQAANDPGIAGRWWRFWNSVNNNSGYLGAGVVAVFLIVFGSWGLHRWWVKRCQPTSASNNENTRLEETAGR